MIISPTLKKKKIEVQLICNIVLVSGAQHSGSVFLQVTLHYTRYIYLVYYYKIMGIIPCAIQ